MEQQKLSLFQFRKNHGYQVFLRFSAEEQPKLLHLAKEMGFELIPEADQKKMNLSKWNTRILSIQTASARLEQQINGSDLMDKYGAEVLSLQKGMPVYMYRRVGLMILPREKNTWELALTTEMANTDQLVGLRVLLVRFLAQALADQGVLCYWGTIKEDTVIIMKQTNSFGEAVLIDATNRVIFSNGGELKLDGSLKILRKDKEVSAPSRMNREEIISFLSVSTCLLSFSGITPHMKKAIYDISLKVTASYALTEGSASL
jgi:hypothetical protein